VKVILIIALLATVTIGAQAPAASGEDAPQLSEKDTLTLTILQQQIEIAGQRLQLALTQLKRPGWHVALDAGQWRYVADVSEKSPPSPE
jgi:hypothetical protein